MVKDTFEAPFLEAMATALIGDNPTLDAIINNTTNQLLPFYKEIDELEKEKDAYAKEADFKNAMKAREEIDGIKTASIHPLELETLKRITVVLITNIDKMLLNTL